MKRFVALAFGLALALALAIFAPRALAAEPLGHSGRVVVSTQGDIAIPAGEQADVVVVIKGHADIRGVVNTLVVVEGTAQLTGATAETVVAVRSTVEVGDGTVVYGEIQRFDSSVHQTGNVDIHGGIVDASGRWLEIGAAFAAVLVLLWLGFGVATLVAGLALAGLAAKQLRSAEQLISREPLPTGVAGLLGVIVIPVVAILLFPTLIGAPLGFGILVVALPLVAFGGYLVAATWLGEIVVRRASMAERERPYLGVVLGVVLLGAIGLVPVLNILVAVASLFGFGAVLLLAIRTLLGSAPRQIPTTHPAPLATGA